MGDVGADAVAAAAPDGVEPAVHPDWGQDQGRVGVAPAGRARLPVDNQLMEKGGGEGHPVRRLDQEGVGLRQLGRFFRNAIGFQEVPVKGISGFGLFQPLKSVGFEFGGHGGGPALLKVGVAAARWSLSAAVLIITVFVSSAIGLSECFRVSGGAGDGLAFVRPAPGLLLPHPGLFPTRFLAGRAGGGSSLRSTGTSRRPGDGRFPGGRGSPASGDVVSVPGSRIWDWGPCRGRSCWLSRSRERRLFSVECSSGLFILDRSLKPSVSARVEDFSRQERFQCSPLGRGVRRSRPPRAEPAWPAPWRRCWPGLRPTAGRRLE